MAKATVYERVTESIVSQLEAGTVPWQKPWNINVGPPRNGKSGHYYRGMNVFLLAMAGQSTPWWFTPKQVNELGGHIRKGERVNWVHFFKPWTPKDKTDQAETFEGFEGETNTRSNRTFLICRAYRVVNLSQCEGPGVDAFREKYAEEEAPRIDFNPIESCESIINGMPQRPFIHHGGARAFYQPSIDRVTLPERETFISAEHYYATAFHELSHSTGHPDRLNRKTIVDAQPFGSPSYSREELVAEMGAAFLCAFAGIEDPTLQNSAAYIKGWLSKLKSDTKALIIAGCQAQKACDFIMGAAGAGQVSDDAKAAA